MVSLIHPGDTPVTAHVLHHEGYHGGWYTLRLHSPRHITKVEPGHCAQLEYGGARYRAPIMRTDMHAGWLELLYQDSTSPPVLQIGDPVRLSAPLGRTFAPDTNNLRPLLIGEGLGIAAVTFLAGSLAQRRLEYQPMVLLGSDISFPFQLRPSRFLVPGMPAGVIAAMPLLEERGITSRLSSTQGLAGCFEGEISGLVHAWIDTLPEAQRNEIALFASGPATMLKSIELLAERYCLPFQGIATSS